MNKLLEALDTLARESVGGVGVKPSETLTTQGIRGIALFLEDGSVAVLPVGGAGHD